MLRNIMKSVANTSPAINTQNVANASSGFPLFSFYAIVTNDLIVNFIQLDELRPGTSRLFSCVS